MDHILKEFVRDAHLELDKLGAPTNRQVRSLLDPMAKTEKITLSLVERIRTIGDRLHNIHELSRDAEKMRHDAALAHLEAIARLAKQNIPPG